jgi:Protein of unknown function (DUF4239)
MSDFIASALIGIVFVSIAVLIVLGSYFAARKLLGSADRARNVVGSGVFVAVRIATFHGLILALVYAQELDDFKGVRNTLTQETVAVSDVYNDARRYGGPDVAPIRTELAQYVASVVREEWPMLGAGKGLSEKAWSQWEDVYQRSLALTPTTDRDKFLAARMRDRIGAIAGFRQTRESAVTARFSEMFWAPALIGLALVSVAFYVYKPRRTHLILLSIFGVYSGVILFFIYAFANPFSVPGKLEPAPFQELLDGEIGQSLPR